MLQPNSENCWAAEPQDLVSKVKNIIIRKAKPQDAKLMSEMAVRSKAYWGYSKELLSSWENDLTVTTEFIEKGIGYVAEVNGIMIGYWVRQAIQSDEMTKGFLFIEPEFIGSGCGRLLFDALKEGMRQKGIQSFTFDADPNAVGFYLKMGGEKIGEMESSVVPGRKLPIIKMQIIQKITGETHERRQIRF